MATIKDYLEAEENLAMVSTRLKQYANDTAFNVTDMEMVKTLEFLAGAVIRRQQLVDNIWNRLTDKQIEKILAKKSA